MSWEPITVDIVVSSVSLLRDQAIAAWAAAGDTVVIDGVTVAEGVAGRGVWRVLGFSAFLTQIGGTPDRYQPYPDLGTFTYPDNTVRNASGMWVNGRFREDPAQTQQHTTSLTLSATNGGATDMVTPITCRATINGITNMGIIYPGKMKFYCGNLTRSAPVWSQVVNGQIIRYAETTFTGADLGNQTGSYSMLAVYDGAYCQEGHLYNGSSAGMTIGVN
jgi:hypothetical protein